jgi:HTH-type transcriptional regulator / antitoxin HigA
VNSTPEFAPQWACAPGETIADALSARGWTREELAARLGQSAEMVEDLLAGAAPITIGVARRLSDVLGASVAFWMARDLQYRQDIERMRRIETEWTRSLPVADMARMGWLPPRLENDINALLDFFDVPSVAAWHRRYSKVSESVEFRISRSFESDPGAVIAWIRQGERIGADTLCKPWDANAMRETLNSVRGLTRIGRPERFLPKLRAAMAACGVVVAVVPAPAGCRASGATLWISEEKALVLLSARHLTDDHFWFTFYHECGHLLLHRGTHVFIDSEATVASATAEDGAYASDVQEEAANAFAVDVLITAGVQESLRCAPLSYRGVLRLAARAGIAPGILVGQLQKMRRVGPERLNRVKRRYQWVDGQLVSRGTK